MKPFTLDSSMTASISGAFYPTGYSMIMFPDEKDAKAIGEQLSTGNSGNSDVYFIPADAILSQISPTVQSGDDPLPSVGTDGATVRAYTKLAREGHSALLVKTADADGAEQLMQVVRTVPYSMAQRYRTLVIEDL